MTVLGVAATIVRSDLRLELRRPVLLGNLALFGAGALVASHLALAGSGRPSDAVSAGALWVVLLFAACLGAGRMLASERDRGTWPALLLAPVDRTAIFLGKTASSCIVVVLLHLALGLMYAALFSPVVSAADVAVIVLIVGLFDLGLAALGTLLALLSMAAGARELLAPVLLLPLAMPALLVATAATVDSFGADAAGPALQSVLFIAAYAGVAIAAGIAAFAELAVE